MDYEILIENLVLWSKAFHVNPQARDALEKAATAITDLLVENQSLRNAANGFKARAEAAERQRDAAIKELDDVAAAVDDLSDFIDKQIFPIVQYDIYTSLRDNADTISVWNHEKEWRGQEEE